MEEVLGPTSSLPPATQRARTLAAISRADLIYAAAYLVLAWVVIFAALVAVRLYPTWIVALAAFVIISARQQALLNVEHSCLHGTFVKGKKWNERIGTWFAASPVGSPFQASRARHLEHHRWLGTDKDPDADLHRGKEKETAAGLLKYFFTGLLGGYAIFVLIALPKVEVSAAQRLRDRRNIILGQVVMAALFTLVGGWWTYPVLWLLPLATLTAAMHLVRSFVEHAVVPSEVPEHGDRLITIRSNPIERFLVAPFNMNLHSEHHRYPGVPAHKLVELRHELEKDDPDEWPLLRKSYLAAVILHLRGMTYAPASA